jgi:hypothetical protein
MANLMAVAVIVRVIVTMRSPPTRFRLGAVARPFCLFELRRSRLCERRRRRGDRCAGNERGGEKKTHGSPLFAASAYACR